MKTITVKGSGNVSVKPDMVVLSLMLQSKNSDYEMAMREASNKIEELNRNFEKLGFEKGSVKTTDFNVRTEYENRKDRNGNYYRVFNGYVITHHLKISFDFSTKMLTNALESVVCCVAHPELSINFTVKDRAAVNEELLKSAAENAKKKAEILCVASGARLGELVNIDYNWGELNVYSHTHYDIEEDCICSAPMSIDIEPDDINATDTVTFVWEIA